jgi:hypothetical protein
MYTITVLLLFDDIWQSKVIIIGTHEYIGDMLLVMLQVIKDTMIIFFDDTLIF